MKTSAFFVRVSFLTFAALAAVLLGPASVARAGGCPTCTSSAECVDTFDGGIAFCVVHDAPVGCGAQTTLCCPGQGCGIDGSGRPTCEGTSCHVIDAVDAGTDAGADASASGTDAGTSGTDAGASGTDAGSSGTDAGASGADAGAGRMDGGTSAPSSSGCGCSAVGRSGANGAAWLALGLALLVVRRRTRRAR